MTVSTALSARPYETEAIVDDGKSHHCLSPKHTRVAFFAPDDHRSTRGDGLGAFLVAVATAGFPVRATEGQAGGLKPLETKGSGPRYLVEPGAGEYPQRGGYGPASYRSISTTPGANKFTFITYKINHSNGSRFLPIDTQAVLLLIVIFMRLMVETTCDE
ncbi:hypothetical protein [Bifidobacterium aerophilum]|uniref:hypothetical protein n=1 Tax=Bifidobacterium aerophilum TaxID=1798155 RepID=UPI001EF8C827|nr:hypothetical protein [Bifidobacterium aerophilum]